MGYQVSWEDFQPAFRPGHEYGEWVAKVTSHTVRLPVYVKAGATPEEKEEKRVEVLQRLVALLEGTN